MRLPLRGLILGSAFLVLACSGPQPKPEGIKPARKTEPPAEVKGHVVSGRLAAAGDERVPDRAKVVVAWVVSAGSPDYVYLFGQGAAAQGRYRLGLSEPPREALNAGQLGVGMLILVRADADVPAGKLSRDQWKALRGNAIGGAARYGIIFKQPNTSMPRKGWWTEFPSGYSCGKGVRQPGETFEAFEPTRCDAVEIEVEDFRKLEWVNWT